MILDFHTHTYPEELAGRVIQNSVRMQVPNHTDGTTTGLKRSMLDAGITHAVTLSIATRPGQTAHIIDSACKMLPDAGEGPRLIPFAGIHPFEEDWRDNLHRIKALGFQGIKLHPDYQQFYIDDARLEPFYREVAALGLIMVFHAGFDVVSPAETHASADRILNVLPLLEKATTILAHMGGYKQEHETIKHLCGRDIYFDTSFNLAEMDIESARLIFRKHTPDRLVFGTDSPWKGQRESLTFFRDRFAKSFLSEAAIENVLWNNGARMLGLSTKV